MGNQSQDEVFLAAQEAVGAHRDSQDLSYGPLPCPKCSKWYKNQHCLTSHMSQDCGKAPRYECTICYSKFKRKYNLKTHVISVHKT
jgi:hypothetical protein